MSTTRLSLCPHCGVTLPWSAVEEAAVCTICGQPAGDQVKLAPTVPERAPARPLSTHPTDPTASALVYLFADKFVRMPAGSGIGIEVPCRATKVDALSLAAVLCATALWSLREQGLVALTTVKRKRAFVFQWNELSVLQLDTDERVGVEGVMMDYLPRPIGRMSLTYQWPYVVQAAVNEVVTLRCLETREARDSPGALFFLGSWVTPNCARIATFTQAAQDIAARWKHFQVSERGLYEVLMKECWDGVQPYDPTWRPERD